MRLILAILAMTAALACHAQPLEPKQAYPLTVRQIHSGHSLTDPLFYPHWPGQYVRLMAAQVQQDPWELINTVIGKSTIPGSPMSYRWENPPQGDSPDARHHIGTWDLLVITERVPLLYEGGSTQQWYRDGIQEQRNALSQFVNNAWLHGNDGQGAPTLLWTTWVHVDGTSGDFRTMLDIQGTEWERMQDHANDRRPVGAPPVYLIPGHTMMARLYDDIALGLVPGITSIHQFFSDAIHTNELGAYAIALIHYACIFNRSPVGLPANLIPDAPAGTPVPSAELAAYLQSMVWDVVTSYERTGLGTGTATSMDQPTSSAAITVAPNPTSDVLHILLPTPAHEAVRATMHTVTGNSITTSVIPIGAASTTIDVRHLSPGVYMLALAHGPTARWFTVAIHR